MNFVFMNESFLLTFHDPFPFKKTIYRLTENKIVYCFPTTQLDRIMDRITLMFLDNQCDMFVLSKIINQPLQQKTMMRGDDF